MPRMSGLELASRLTRDRPDLPIVFASGFLQDEVTRASLSLDAPHIAFCDKPFRPEDLIAKVGALLEGAARRGPSGGPLVMK
jgi:CheY-like chemotaxis protein